MGRKTKGPEKDSRVAEGRKDKAGSSAIFFEGGKADVRLAE